MAEDREALALIHDVIGGSVSAWKRFFGRHAVTVDKLVRSSHSLGSLRRSDDECRNVMALVFEKLRKHDFRALRTFERWASEHPGKRFDDWLTIVVTNVVRDHMRSKLGERRDDGESEKRLVNTLADSLDEAKAGGHRPAFTDQAAARQLLAFAAKHLSGDQLAALNAWLAGQDHEEIARGLGLPSAREADKLVRAALAKLRRHVGL